MSIVLAGHSAWIGTWATTGTGVGNDPGCHGWSGEGDQSSCRNSIWIWMKHLAEEIISGMDLGCHDRLIPYTNSYPFDWRDGMRHAIWIGAMAMLVLAVTSHAEMVFDPRYERDYNIFNPATQYQSDNPLNQANTYDPDSAFNPVNRYDPGNPANPTNKYSPNNPFNPVNQYHPDNPLNPANRYNPNVPFAPLDGGSGKRRR